VAWLTSLSWDLNRSQDDLGRARELLGLNVAEVGFTHATALVTGRGPKPRLVPIGKTALRLLASYVKGIRPFLVRDGKETALFLDRRGERLPCYTLRRLVPQYPPQAGLDVHVTAHTFRRSCTTELIRGGANLYHIKLLLGHERLDTLQHYARPSIDDLKATHQKCRPGERGDD